MELFLQSFLLMFVMCCSGQPSRNFEAEIGSASVVLNLTGTCSADASATEFQTIVVSSGNVYVGATNAIIKLSPFKLSISNLFKTGPDLYASACPSAPYCDSSCSSEMKCENNYNKYMIPYRDRLLACGTLYAVCDLLYLHNLSSLYEESNELKCKTDNNVFHVTQLSTRSREKQKITAAIFANRNETDKDVFILGNFASLTTESNIQFMLGPNTLYPYFSVFDDTENIYAKDIIKSFHFSWTNDEYLYIVWGDASNSIQLTRFCTAGLDPPGRGQLRSLVDNARLSMTQLELQCPNTTPSPDSVIKVKVLSGIFYVLYRSEGNTLLCSATVSDINFIMNNARESCYKNGTGSTLDGRFGCPNFTSFSLDWKTCNAEKSTFIVGVKVTEEKIMKQELLLPNQEATSFTVGEENDFLAAFIGTQKGDILKIPLGMNNTAISENITFQTKLPIIDTTLDEFEENLFAITNRTIGKAAVADCEGQYPTCTDCLASLDSYCGWCVLQSRCTRKNACNSSENERKWINATQEVDRCPAISMINPNEIAVGATETLNLTFSGTPLQSDLNYSCEFAFTDGTVLRSSTLNNFDSSNGQCEFNAIPASIIPPSSDRRNISLNINYEGTKLFSKMFLVYSCSNIKALNPFSVCTSCTSSQWDCRWCLETATCSSSSCHNNEIVVADKCPQVTGIIGSLDPISVNQEKTFYLSTYLLPLSATYTCQYNFCEEKEISSAANVNSSTYIVECTPDHQMLICNKPSSQLRVSVRQEDYIIDGLQNVSVEIFNCSATADSCGTCVSFHNQFEECGWCNDSSTCAPMFRCPTAITEIQECPTPSIQSVSPTSGPTKGGTRVTINGQNLGSNINQISEVTIEVVKCDVIPDLYIPSKRIVCETQASTKELNGYIEISTTYSNQTIRSSQPFAFKVVKATTFSPTFVLRQSFVTVQGTNLDVGNNATIHFSNGRSNVGISLVCSERAYSSMSCQLPLEEDNEASLFVSVDNYTERLGKVKFADNPSLKPKDDVKGFQGGGGLVRLQLSSLDGVVTASLCINNQNCQICELKPKEADNVICTLPKQATNRKRRETGNSQNASLLLNKVHDLPIGPVTYESDPTLNEITSLPCDVSSSTTTPNNTTGEESDETITIRIPGQNFNAIGSENSDYKVIFQPIGVSVNISCNVSFISNEELLCRSVKSQLNSYTNKEMNIRVTIAQLEPLTQSVVYCSSNEDGDDLLPLYIALPILVVLIAIIIVLMVLFKRKSKLQAEEQKMILQKLDDLENRTRETARNAYYELQLGYMNNLSDNLTHRIIYLAPELYFTQTLFNLSRGHPVLNKQALQREPTSVMEAIEEWTDMLKNREFAIIFIRTLEKQKRFTVQEKGNVASLLAVSLFSDLPYFTSIMFELLTELIQNHVQKNPKLLLRRSESVVEKMVSYWLSITLYDECITDKSGKPIFLLTKAIHYLVNSAPSDVIDHKAMHSLNESTLLGEEISHETMILQASIEDKETGEATSLVEVTVVDVDSITQAKEKIIEAVFKDKPYSEQPKPDDLDFELLGTTATNKGIVLSDIDSVSKEDKGYTQINTLKHYHVPEKAYVVLRPVDALNSESDDSKTPLLKGRTRNIYHLINPADEEAANGIAHVENGGGKRANALLEGMIKRPFQEIYLTRMVRSKSTLQEYVDAVFNSILRPDPIPYPVRYFFQFLDKEATKHKITDNEVTHIWKTNSLLLRYWVNVLKNPEFLFDLNKTIIVDSCLNVITQAFMDACTTTSRKLGNDSPSNKLLYAKDAAQYKSMVTEFFANVSNTPILKQEEMDDILKKSSKKYANRFNEQVASQQLYQYLFKYKDQMLEAVREKNSDLAKKVEDLTYKMEGGSKAETSVV